MPDQPKHVKKSMETDDASLDAALPASPSPGKARPLAPGSGDGMRSTRAARKRRGKKQRNRKRRTRATHARKTSARGLPFHGRMGSTLAAFIEATLPSTPRQKDIHNGATDLDVARAWPRGVDQPTARAKLLEAYLANRNLELDEEKLCRGEWEVSFLELFKRLHTNDPAVFGWWERTTTIGAVQHTTCPAAYAKEAVHCFSNACPKHQPVKRGSTHVAVGFVDLGGVEFDVLPGGSQNASKPAVWVGVEASAYCVAKTLVIQHMIPTAELSSAGSSSGSGAGAGAGAGTGVGVGAGAGASAADIDVVDAIMEVWYSSTWSPATLKAFRRAVSAAIHEYDLRTATSQKGASPSVFHRQLSLSPAVKKYLLLWKTASVPHSQARTQWLASLTSSSAWYEPSASCLRQAERVALLQYELTGEWTTHDDDVGSVTMFCLMPSDKRQVDSMLGTLRIEDLLKERGMRDSSSETATLLHVGVNMVRQRVRKIVHHVRTGTVEVHVCSGMVSLDNPRVVKAIRSLAPDSVYWSNVLDFSARSVFHTVARACSAKTDTIHVGYSMNWVRETWGAVPLDFVSSAAMSEELLTASQQSYSLLLEATGCQDVLIAPPLTHPFNMSGFATRHLTMSAWTEQFFLDGHIPDSQVALVRGQHVCHNPFARFSHIAEMVWTYDPAVTFNVVSRLV